MGLKPFIEALDDRVLVCDGAMGTMLYAKGIFLNRSFDELNLTQPELVGDVHQPLHVFINAKGKQNGVIVNGADGVKIDGFSTKGYKANGFFVVNDSNEQTSFGHGASVIQ